MVTIHYVERDGRVRTVEAVAGHTVMETALAAGVDGIIAECGGACACATCHVHVVDGWADCLPPPDEVEDVMLDFAEDRREESRLACQIRISAAIDGMTFRVV